MISLIECNLNFHYSLNHEMNILQHDGFSSITPFPTNDDKKNEPTTRKGTEGRYEANAKVRKAEEFPGVSPRVYFARNYATFLRNKAGKVIRPSVKNPLSLFSRINCSHVRRIRDGREKKERGAMKREHFG